MSECFHIKGSAMFSNGRTVKVILAVSVLVFVIRIASYHIDKQASHKDGPSFSPMMSTKLAYKNGSGEETFVYSEENVINTLLGIRNKNCRALNQFRDTERRESFCNKLQECNLATSEAQGLPNGCKRRLPKCIIIGVAKSGTTELINFLSMHPNIVIRSHPGYLLSFFSKHWEKGTEWHRKQMPFTFEDQITLYKANYFYKPEVPERMKMSDPNIKLILIVRNPVDRLISYYTFHNPEKPLSDVSRFAEERAEHWQHYDKPFEHYLRFFSRSQIHVIDSEKFQKDPQNVLFEVETFLDLPHIIKKTDFVFNKDKGFFCLRDVNNKPSSCFGDDRGRKKLQNDTEFVKARVRQFFKVHNERFFNLTGLRFNWH